MAFQIRPRVVPAPGVPQWWRYVDPSMFARAALGQRTLEERSSEDLEKGIAKAIQSLGQDVERPPVLPPWPAHETGPSDVRTLLGLSWRQCAVCHAPLAGRANRQTCSPACRRARSRLRQDGRLQRQIRGLQMEILRLKMQELDGRFAKLESEVKDPAR
jgi:hypothetical protein